MGKLAPRQEHPALASKAFDPYICPQPDNFPLVSTAGMRLAHAQDIIDRQIGEHAGDYNMQGLATPKNFAGGIMV
jgi:hypothetical protein